MIGLSAKVRAAHSAPHSATLWFPCRFAAIRAWGYADTSEMHLRPRLLSRRSVDVTPVEAKRDGDDYEAFIRRRRPNPPARTAKFADLPFGWRPDGAVGGVPRRGSD